MDESEAQDNLFAKKNETFSVELRSYPGSGALWQCAAPEGIEFVEKKSTPLGEGIGGEVLQTFTFRANVPGSHELVFVLKRPWEPSSRRRKVVIVKVE